MRKIKKKNHSIKNHSISDNKFNKTEVKMFLSEWKEDAELREVAISLIKNGIVIKNSTFQDT